MILRICKYKKYIYKNKNKIKKKKKFINNKINIKSK